jgi:hypothetical protein
LMNPGFRSDPYHRRKSPVAAPACPVAPWYDRKKVRTFSLPVYRRAIMIPASFASAPELGNTAALSVPGRTSAMSWFSRVRISGTPIPPYTKGRVLIW